MLGRSRAAAWAKLSRPGAGAGINSSSHSQPAKSPGTVTGLARVLLGFPYWWQVQFRELSCGCQHPQVHRQVMVLPGQIPYLPWLRPSSRIDNDAAEISKQPRLCLAPACNCQPGPGARPCSADRQLVLISV